MARAYHLVVPRAPINAPQRPPRGHSLHPRGLPFFSEQNSEEPPPAAALDLNIIFSSGNPINNNQNNHAGE